MGGGCSITHYLSPLGLVWLGAKVGIYSLQISDFTALFLLHFLPHDCVCIEKLRPRSPLGVQSSCSSPASPAPPGCHSRARAPVHAGSAGSTAPFHTACCLLLLAAAASTSVLLLLPLLPLALAPLSAPDSQRGVGLACCSDLLYSLSLQLSLPLAAPPAPHHRCKIAPAPPTTYHPPPTIILTPVCNHHRITASLPEIGSRHFPESENA